MTRSPTLEQYLLHEFSAPPDAKTVAKIAADYKVTPEAVWSAVRRIVPHPSRGAGYQADLDVPVTPPPMVSRTRESSRPRGFDAVVSAFRQHGHVLKPTKKGFITRCLLHQDRRPSLVINRAPDDGRVALPYCHSCKKKPGHLLAPVGLTSADCFPDDLTARARPVRAVVAEYPYVSMAGALVATKARYRVAFHAKRFGWRVGDRWKLTDAEKDALPLYQERELIEAATVYVVEGEKAVDRFVGSGASGYLRAARCGYLESRWTESLRLLGTQHVVILTDNDVAGRAHGELVATALHDAQIAVQVVALPDLSAGQDVFDWLAQGGTVADLEAIVAATPAWTPGLAEQQRVDQQRTKWREKKARQRRERREAVPLRSSDTRDVPLRSQEPQDVPPVPLSPLRTISRVTSKGTAVSGYISSGLVRTSMTRDVPRELVPLPVIREEPSVMEISTEISFEVEIHPGGDDDDDDG